MQPSHACMQTDRHSAPSGGLRPHLASPDGDRNCIASRRATQPPSGSIRNSRLLALYSSAIALQPSMPQGAAIMASAVTWLCAKAAPVARCLTMNLRGPHKRSCFTKTARTAQEGEGLALCLCHTCRLPKETQQPCRRCDLH